MSKHTISKKSCCCYYRAEGPQIIYCGIDITTVHRVFQDKAKAKDYKEKCCRKDYTKCPIFKMLEGECQ